MAPTVITTPGASNANSYCSVSRADTILTDERMHAKTTWSTLSGGDDDKGRLLIWSTYLHDALFDWPGYPSNPTTQALRFPRTGFVDRDGYVIDSTTIPAFLERSCAELAYALIEDKTIWPSALGQGLSELSVDVIRVKFDQGALQEMIPPYISDQLLLWGARQISGGDVGIVPLRRV